MDIKLQAELKSDWFVDHDHYIPDYAVLHQMGIQVRDRYLNGSIHAISNAMWYRWVWPRLMAPIQRLLLEAPVLNRNLAYDRVFIQAIHSACEDRRLVLPHLSYTALFDLFSQCSAQYYQVAYGIDDLYAADKHQQSSMVRVPQLQLEI